MWARISELILGVWLLLSHCIFSTGIWDDIAIAMIILLLASLSYIDKLNKMHLLQALPAGWLLYLGYSYPTSVLPFGFQNFILTALTLLMFALVPSHASDHPRPWKNYSKG